MMDAFELPRTLVQSLQRRAAQTPDQVALRFLADCAEQNVVLSYRDLDQRARTIAAALQANVALGERAVLLFPSGPDYVAAFFGCLYAGVIAVPAYPPESTRRHHQERLLSIISDAEPRVLLTIASLGDGLAQIENAPPVLSVDTLEAQLAERWVEPELHADDIAFLQYTSGSTALPKGVQVSHGNLVANEVLIRRGFGIDLNPDDVIVSWLPLYHDMGLIGGLLQPIFSGVPCVLMSPAYFLGRPLRWLEAISEYRGTISGGPDFAYRLCSERVSESALERLDLSTWRVAYSGSEPIRLDTLERFAEKFATCGFTPNNFFASYGLAEATLFVAGGTRGHGIPALRLDEQALAANRAEPGQGNAIMSCGTSQPEHAVLIADPHTLSELPDNHVGELWASGPSIARVHHRQVGKMVPLPWTVDEPRGLDGIEPGAHAAVTHDVQVHGEAGGIHGHDECGERFGVDVQVAASRVAAVRLQQRSRFTVRNAVDHGFGRGGVEAHCRVFGAQRDETLDESRNFGGCRARWNPQRTGCDASQGAVVNRRSVRV